MPASAGIYEYIGNSLFWTDNSADLGVQVALGPMGTDCTEYTYLLVAPNRVQGILACYFDGLQYLDKGTDAIAKQEHAWP